MLNLVSLGLLGGAADVKACWNHTGPLNPSQRAAIGLRKRDGSGRLTHPSYDSFRDILAAVDPEVLAATLSAWLCANEGLLPRSLAFDGKAIGALKGGIITLCHHATGAPVAMAIHRGAKDDCEMPDARRLIDAVQPSLAGAKCVKPSRRSTTSEQDALPGTFSGKAFTKPPPRKARRAFARCCAGRVPPSDSRTGMNGLTGIL